MLMIKAKQMQQRRMEIMNTDAVLDCPKAEFVGRPVGHSPLDATPSHPHRETIVVMVPSISAFRDRRPTEFAAPDHQCFVEQSTPLQVA